MELKRMFEMYKHTKYNIWRIEKNIKKKALNGFYSYGLNNSIKEYNDILELRNEEQKILKNYIVCKQIINDFKTKKHSKILIDIYTTNKTIQQITNENKVNIRTTLRIKAKIEEFYSKIDMEDIWKHCLTCYLKRKQ